MEKVGLLDRALTPLHLLERTRGWKRLGLVLLYLLIALVIGVFGWRELSLWRLPRIGEPFDTVQQGTIAVADADNAMVLYRDAASRLIRSSATYRVTSPSAWEVTDWSAADPELRRWAVDNRAGFEIWIRAAERPDSLLVQPKDRQDNPDMTTVFSLDSYARIALLEGSRLEQGGDLEGAWGMYRRALRSSRHAGRHGNFMQRLIGHDILRKVRGSIQRWMILKEVTPSQLRRAISDLEASSAMTSPISEMVQADYFTWQSMLSQPVNWYKWGLERPNNEETWYQHWSFVKPTERFFLNEPKRSLRIHRLITAGILAQCDRPASVRPKLFSSKYLIYELDDRTPSAVAALTPAELTAWAERSTLQFIGFQSNDVIAALDSERSILATLQFEMAERAFEIEHGKPPVTYGDLLGAYLKALPEGVKAGDLISAAADPK